MVWFNIIMCLVVWPNINLGIADVVRGLHSRPIWHLVHNLSTWIFCYVFWLVRRKEQEQVCLAFENIFNTNMCLAHAKSLKRCTKLHDCLAASSCCLRQFTSTSTWVGGNHNKKLNQNDLCLVLWNLALWWQACVCGPLVILFKLTEVVRFLCCNSTICENMFWVKLKLILRMVRLTIISYWFSFGLLNILNISLTL